MFSVRDKFRIKTKLAYGLVTEIGGVKVTEELVVNDFFTVKVFCVACHFFAVRCKKWKQKSTKCMLLQGKSFHFELSLYFLNLSTFMDLQCLTC